MNSLIHQGESVDQISAEANSFNLGHKKEKKSRDRKWHNRCRKGHHNKDRKGYISRNGWPKRHPGYWIWIWRRLRNWQWHRADNDVEQSEKENNRMLMQEMKLKWNLNIECQCKRWMLKYNLNNWNLKSPSLALTFYINIFTIKSTIRVFVFVVWSIVNEPGL